MMKTILLRYILALFLCGITTAAMAAEKSDTLLSEDFSNFTIPSGLGPHLVEKEYGIWEFSYCEINANIKTLKIVCNNQNSPIHKGYAQTPPIRYNGDVNLSFKYGNSSTNNATMKITITDGGTFIGGETTKEVTVTRRFADEKGPLSANYSIIGATANTKIEFGFFKPDNNNYYYYYIDDIVITKDGMTLSEAKDNNSVIAAHPDTTMNVKTVRTLQENIWNTMCLPFDVTKATLTEAWETSVELRTYSGYSNNTMSFSSTESVTAGKPFLIKVGKTITNPTFESVTISNAADTVVTYNGVSFIGTYSGSNLNTDGTHLFITTSGTVARPANNTQNHLKGLRAYIEMPANAGVRLNIDGETTDIQQVAIDEERPNALYNLKAQRLQSPKKGIIIKDGKLSFIK